MKRILKISLLFTLVLTINSCKDDTGPVTPTDTDIRNQFEGEFNTELNVYDAETGALKDEYTFWLKVQKDSKDEDKFSFYYEALYLFMTAQNIRKITPGYGFDIPEQDTKNFGTLEGKNYLNVAGDNNRYTGIYYTGEDKFTIYMEKDNGGSANDFLYEFFLTRR